MKSIYRIRNDNGHPEPLVRNWMLFSEEKKEKKGFFGAEMVIGKSRHLALNSRQCVLMEIDF